MRASQQREAAVAFQRTVLNADREVDDALTAYAQAQRRRADAARAAAQNAVALRASQQRDREGLVDSLDADSTQMLQSQIEVADADVQAITDLVRLDRALGGGWEIAGAAFVAPANRAEPRFPPRDITDLVDVVPSRTRVDRPVRPGPGRSEIIHRSGDSNPCEPATPGDTGRWTTGLAPASRCNGPDRSVRGKVRSAWNNRLGSNLAGRRKRAGSRSPALGMAGAGICRSR